MTAVYLSGARPTAAARILLADTALADVVARVGVVRGIGLTFSVTIPDEALHGLSTGERLLCACLASVSGRGDEVSLWHLADRLDAPNAAAVARAVGVLLGADVAEVRAS